MFSQIFSIDSTTLKGIRWKVPYESLVQDTCSCEWKLSNQLSTKSELYIICGYIVAGVNVAHFAVKHFGW